MEPRRRALLRTLAAGSVAGLSGCALLPDHVDAPAGRRPRTGELTTRWASLLDRVDRYLADHGVPGAGLAVATPAGSVVAGGVGWQSPGQTEPVRPDSLFRIASLSKPITAGATRHLVATTDLSLDDAVLPLLDVEPPGGAPADPRFAEITVRHLLTHSGGWDRQETFDPMLRPTRVAGALDVDPPPDERDVARFLLGRELAFEPGTDSAYANVGYLLLGLLIEDVSGRPYQEYVADAVLAPAGVDPANLRLGRTLPADRPEREVEYAANGHCRDAFGSPPWRRVPCPDGGFAVEPMAAHGGHVATAGAYARFFAAFDSFGRRRGGEPVPDVANGALPGTVSTAVHARSGHAGVVLCNRRTDDPAGLRDAVRRGLARQGVSTPR